jgi:uncharacterized protein with PIN domain
MAASACDRCRRLFLRGTLPDDRVTAPVAPLCPVCGGKLRETCESCRALSGDPPAGFSATECPACGGTLREATAREVREHVQKLKDAMRARPSE